MIDPRSRALLVLLGLVVLALVINLVRKRQLQERYALLWLLAGAVLVLAPLLVHQLDRLAYMLGIEYPPALLLLLAIIGLMLIIFQLSLAISHNSDQIKVLSQEIGLLRQQLEAALADKQSARSSTAEDEIAEETETRGEDG